MNVLSPVPGSPVSESIEFEDGTKTDPKSTLDKNSGSPTETDGPAKRRKKKSLAARLNSATMMWMRRIHLFSGLFMLPWVLLYGFTAMLFNHSTWFSDARVETVMLSESEKNSLPKSEDIAKSLVENLQRNNMKIELADTPNAVFTRSAFASFETDKNNQTLVIDLNTGNGYRRVRNKPESSVSEESKKDPPKEKHKPDLKKGVGVSLDAGESINVTELVNEIDSDKDPEKKIKLNLPTLEFNALVDGELKRLRFSQQSNRRRSRPAPDDDKSGTSEKNQNAVKGTVVAVGANPRNMTWRSYLLRLHMAHGYPVTRNARYWWAYAVDAMFVCMVFWGLSGVFMWWQIKRTRVLGFILLILSAIIATYLAFAMHWQLVNG